MKTGKLGLIVGCAVVSVLGVFFFLNAGYIVSRPAGQPQQADAIVILGGDSGARSLRGLELYRMQFAPLILLTVVGDKELPTEYAIGGRVKILSDGGIRKDVIEFVPAARNSWQEAERILSLARSRGFRRVIVVSDPPHMLRLEWTWRKVFRGETVSYVLLPSSPAWWNAGRWWKNRQSFRFVVTEYLKLGYYFVKYYGH